MSPAARHGRPVHAGQHLPASWQRIRPIEWETFPHAADVGVRGRGNTLAEAFAGAAMALTAVVCDPAKVAVTEGRPRGTGETLAFECAAPDDELLLVDWLNTLIYTMATRRLLFSHFDVSIADHRLTATARGEPVDVARHQPAAEIKGATYCELAVRRLEDGRWLAQCVVDV